VIFTSSVEKTETVPNVEKRQILGQLPYTPPPDPEAEEPPTFATSKRTDSAEYRPPDQWCRDASVKNEKFCVPARDRCY
jgi:hypothetical protein